MQNPPINKKCECEFTAKSIGCRSYKDAQKNMFASNDIVQNN